MKAVILSDINNFKKEHGHGPTVLELYTKLLETLKWSPSCTVEKITEEIDNLKYAGQLFVEHGSNRWSTERSVPH